MKNTLRTVTLIGGAVSVLVLLSVSRLAAPAASGDSGSADNFLIDMDPSGTPANGATRVGSVESCARLNDNGVLDADEDEEDEIIVDLVTGPAGIPASHPMIGYSLAFYFPAAQLEVADEDQYYMLDARAGSSLFSVSFLAEPGEYISGAVDTAMAAAAESGPGVLSRLTLEAADDALPGVYDLTIGTSSSGATLPIHIDPDNEAHIPQNVVDGTARPSARVAIGVACPPAPIPAPTGTPPPPSATPVPPPPAPVTCVGFPATVIGSVGDDTLRGTVGADVIAGLGGDDRISGLGGGDLVCGGPGDDRIRGARGEDFLFGEQGDDSLVGYGADDQLFGGPGDDLCRGGRGDDFAIACEELRSADEPE